MQRVSYCTFHPGEVATDNLKNGVLSPLFVCKSCLERFMDASPPVCRHCRVKVKSKDNVRPRTNDSAKRHRTSCPRHGLDAEGDPVPPEKLSKT